MSRIIANNIRHNDATADSLSFDSSGNVSAPGNLSVTGTSTLTGNTTVTGSLTANGLAYPSAGPLSNRNLIINGAMQVAQRGTSSTASGYGTVDRFRAGYGGGDQTQSQVALTSGDPYDEGFRYIMRVTNTATATGAGNNRNIQQKIEAQDIASCGWNYTSSSSYLTLSFWVRSSVAQEFYGYLRTEDGTSQIYPFSLGSLSADTWTKVTKTIPGNSNLQFDNNSNLGLEITVAPFFGTDFTDSGVSVDTWAAYASGTRTPDYTNTWANTTDATFDITGVQLEVGQVATPFEHRSYGDELARCQRYFRRYCNGQTYASSPCRMVGSGSSTVAYGSMTLTPSMRAVPSVNFASIRLDDMQSGPAITSFSVQSYSLDSELFLRADASSGGITQYRPYYVLANATSSGRLDFSAEL